MRKALIEIAHTLESPKSDSIVKQSLKIAEIKYTELQNIVLAYQKYNNIEVELRGTVMDISLNEDYIGLVLKCLVYNYDTAMISCKVIKAEPNITAIAEIIPGASILISGTVKFTNQGSYISDANVIINKRQERKNE